MSLATGPTATWGILFYPAARVMQRTLRQDKQPGAAFVGNDGEKPNVRWYHQGIAKAARSLARKFR